MRRRARRISKVSEDRAKGAELAGLPGADLVVRGMSEIRGAELTECALLVLIAAPRLRHLGLDVPERNDIPRPYEHQLFGLLERTHGKAAYSRYGSLIRRLTSFSRSLAARRAQHRHAHGISDSNSDLADEPGE